MIAVDARRRSTACILALLAEVLIFFRHVLFSNKVGIPYDLDAYHQPLAGFIAASLHKGSFPLWDPYSYCGVPFYANINAQLFYPPAWPFFLFAAVKPNYLFRLLEWETVLHIFLAGVFTYVLLRTMRLSRGAALLGGTCFQLGGFFATETQHLGAVCGTAWMPLAWTAVLLLAERFTPRRLALLAFALAMATLAGFPATIAAVIGSTLLLAGLAVLLRRARPGLLLWTGAAIVLTVLVSAVELLPARELQHLSIAAMRGEWTVSGGGIPVQSFVSMLLPNHYHIFNQQQYALQHLPWNPIYLYLYCGLAGLVLGLLAIVWSKDRYRPVFVLLGILCALWMLCDNTPVGLHLFPLLPKALKGGFYPEFATAAFLLSFIVLAALGAERFLAPRGPLWIALVIAATAFDLTYTGANNWLNTNLYPGTSYRQVDGSREILEHARALTRETTLAARIDTAQASHTWAVAAPFLEVPTANGDDPLALWRLLQVRLCFAEGPYWTRYYQVVKPQSPVLDLLNVRFLLTRDPNRPDENKWRYREELDNGERVYENKNVRPRFFLVDEVRHSGSLKETLAVLRSPEFDPATTAIVEGDAQETARPGGRTRPPGNATVLAYGDRELELESDSPAPAFLVTSEASYPGWRAEIDGQGAPLIMTNGAFRGLPVPAGRHKIRMKFAPDILWYGAAMSLAGWLLLAVLTFPPRRNRI